jgi:antitoxin VapB
MSLPQHISLSFSGAEQVLTIPHEFALSVTEVLIRKEGSRLIIEPITSGSLLSLLANLEDTADDFPNVDEGLLPLDDIVL